MLASVSILKAAIILLLSDQGSPTQVPEYLLFMLRLPRRHNSMTMYIYMGCKGRASEGFFSGLWVTSFSMFLWVWLACNNSWNCILFHRIGGDKQPINSCQQVFGNVFLLENNRWFLLQFWNSLKFILTFVAAFKSPIILHKICLLQFFCRGNTYL